MLDKLDKKFPRGACGKIFAKLRNFFLQKTYRAGEKPAHLSIRIFYHKQYFEKSVPFTF